MGHAEHLVENGVNPELLLGGKYGHSLHIWDLRKRRHLQSLDLGAEQQMVLELRGASTAAARRYQSFCG
jgi:methanethiol oxidase